MSTLVNILLATVLNLLSPGNNDLPAEKEIDTCMQYMHEESLLQFEELKPEHIISKDEQSL